MQPDPLLEVYAALVSRFRHKLPPHLRGDAEDLTQECLLAAWVAATKPGHVRDFKPYLHAIANNKFDDALSERYRHREVSLDDPGAKGFVEKLRHVADTYLKVAQELHEKLVQGIARLRPDERTILELSLIEEIGHAEACERIGVSRAEGSRLKHRALGKLKFHFRSEIGRRTQKARGHHR